MKTILWSSLVVSLTCSCARNELAVKPDSSFGERGRVRNKGNATLREMTDDDLGKILGPGSVSLEEATRRLQIAVADGQIAPGGSFYIRTYRFPAGRRSFFMDVNQSNIVTRAFFSDPRK